MAHAEFEAHTDGGYPMIYLDKDNCVLCADCANTARADGEKGITGDIYYEGETLFCENCSAQLDSAYGDPYAEEEVSA